MPSPAGPIAYLSRHILHQKYWAKARMHDLLWYQRHWTLHMICSPLASSRPIPQSGPALPIPTTALVDFPWVWVCTYSTFCRPQPLVTQMLGSQLWPRLELVQGSQLVRPLRTVWIRIELLVMDSHHGIQQYRANLVRKQTARPSLPPLNLWGLGSCSQNL